MSAFLTYEVKRWSSGDFVPAKPALRQKYGLAVADVIEIVAFALAERRDRPLMMDIKATLQAIVDDPLGVDVALLDAQTDALLMREAVSRFRKVVGPAVELERLPPEALASCAAAALQGLASLGGRPSTDCITVPMVRELLRLVGRRKPAERHELIVDALRACDLKHGDDTVKRLLLKANQVS